MRDRFLFTSAIAIALFGCSGAEGASASDSRRAAVKNPGATAETPRPPHGPPPEAFAACKGSADGEACGVQLDDGEIAGTCRKGPHGEPELACVPNAPPPMGPPPEAIAACKELAADAACSVTLGERTISGKCQSAPEAKGPLVCIPKDLPPPGPPPEALAACKDHPVESACSVQLGVESIVGKCLAGPGGKGPLACVPKDLPPPGPPPEAVAACKDLSADAACSVKLGDQAIFGKCRLGPAGQGPFACAPLAPPPPPPAD